MKVFAYPSPLRRLASPAAPLAVLLLAALGATAPPGSEWATARKPAPGPPLSIGGYSSGCIQGAAALAVIGTGYQVARPSRHRHYGHPELIDYVVDLGQRVSEDNLGVLFVGDLGQPKGGPAPSGHRSHQSGLDADLWFWYPKAAARGPMPAAKTEKLSPRTLVNRKTHAPTAHFTPRVQSLLRRAAVDPRVDRIFVNPVIKRELCTKTANPDARTDHDWLRKLRPWWGHDSHFHVRLRCPESSPDCVSQGSLPKGDGCDDLDWWFDAKAQADRKKRRNNYRKGIGSAVDFPAQCQRLVD